MTASEPPAKWGADSRGVDDVVCRVEEGRAVAARRRRRENQGKEEWNRKMADSKASSAEDKVGRCEHSKHASSAEDKVGRYTMTPHAMRPTH